MSFFNKFFSTSSESPAELQECEYRSIWLKIALGSYIGSPPLYSCGYITFVETPDVEKSFKYADDFVAALRKRAEEGRPHIEKAHAQ